MKKSKSNFLCLSFEFCCRFLHLKCSIKYGICILHLALLILIFLSSSYYSFSFSCVYSLLLLASFIFVFRDNSFSQESHEEESKGIRADIQILNLTSNSFRELKANVFFLAKLVNLQRIYMSKGK